MTTDGPQQHLFEDVAEFVGSYLYSTILEDSVSTMAYPAREYLTHSKNRKARYRL